MEFLFFCDGAKNRFSGRGPLGLWAFVVVCFVQLIRFFRVCRCCITRVLSCLVVIAVVLAKLSRLWASVVALLGCLSPVLSWFCKPKWLICLFFFVSLHTQSLISVDNCGNTNKYCVYSQNLQTINKKVETQGGKGR